MTSTLPQWIDRYRLHQEVLAGTFLNLGSATSVEIAASVGFDWLLIDLEHGSGSLADLRGMLLACRGSKSSPVVRIPSVDADTVKFVMDSGAAGVMFPYVSSVAEAERAVEAIKYPPQGKRGVAGLIRATNYGQDWQAYFDDANDNSLVIVQIETPEAVEAAEDIAAVEGVDVLFVGPLDLSVNLGCPGEFENDKLIECHRRVVTASEANGKTAGILVKSDSVQHHKDIGFRFIALGSDAGSVSEGMKTNLEKLRS